MIAADNTYSDIILISYVIGLGSLCLSGGYLWVKKRSLSHRSDIKKGSQK